MIDTSSNSEGAMSPYERSPRAGAAPSHLKVQVLGVEGHLYGGFKKVASVYSLPNSPDGVIPFDLSKREIEPIDRLTASLVLLEKLNRDLNEYSVWPFEYSVLQEDSEGSIADREASLDTAFKAIIDFYNEPIMYVFVYDKDAYINLEDSVVSIVEEKAFDFLNRYVALLKCAAEDDTFAGWRADATAFYHRLRPVVSYYKSSGRKWNTMRITKRLLQNSDFTNFIKLIVTRDRDGVLEKSLVCQFTSIYH